MPGTYWSKIRFLTPALSLLLLYTMMKNISVIGAGKWGTALAGLLTENGYKTTLFDRESVKNIQKTIQNTPILVNALPSHATREVWQKIAPFVTPETIVVNGSKGLEEGTHKRLSVVLQETLPNVPPGNICTISGPSFAEEVVAHQPTTVVVAGSDPKILKQVQEYFRNDWFLVYLHDDMIGVEMGGAVKNVLAIAAGLCDGMKLGLNTRAALITRGIYEMAKLGKELGANPLTFAGLTGIGDLILTCTGPLSRNRNVGLQLGKGESIAKILQNMTEVAEGVKTAKAVYELGRELHVNMPICKEIYLILYEGKSPRKSLKDLLTLELKLELGGLFV